MSAIYVEAGFRSVVEVGLVEEDVALLTTRNLRIRTTFVNF